MFKTIVWATDGSENADRGLAYARKLAADAGCELVAVHSKELLTGRVGGFPLLADEDEIEVLIGRQVDQVKEAGIDARAIFVDGKAGHAADSIARVARSLDADLIVVGTHGRTPFAGFALGSVAQRLLHVAPCPVLAVPPATHVATPTETKTLEVMK
jgi:nucleotide-binding universal stress UspA family protein